jgi:hypothetical protein
MKPAPRGERRPVGTSAAMRQQISKYTNPETRRRLADAIARKPASESARDVEVVQHGPRRD